MDKTEDIYTSDPTTFNEYFLKYLVINGMSSEQAIDIMATVKEEDSPMKGRWNDTFEGYPDTMLPILMFGVRREALKYIDENCPKAWFRPVFVD